MLNSENINELVIALAAAQEEMKPPEKDKAAQYGKYASLGSVLSCIKGPLRKHNLVLTQQLGREGEQTVLVTTLMHTSGQFIKSSIPVIPMKHPNPLQGIGGAITYLKRYSIVAMLCIDADEDTDGNIEVAQTQKNNGNSSIQNPAKVDKQISNKQVEEIYSWIKNYSDQEWFDKALSHFKIDDPYQLKESHYVSIKDSHERRVKDAG